MPYRNTAFSRLTACVGGAQPTQQNRSITECSTDYVARKCVLSKRYTYQQRMFMKRVESCGIYRFHFRRHTSRTNQYMCACCSILQHTQTVYSKYEQSCCPLDKRHCTVTTRYYHDRRVHGLFDATKPTVTVGAEGQRVHHLRLWYTERGKQVPCENTRGAK